MAQPMCCRSIPQNDTLIPLLCACRLARCAHTCALCAFEHTYTGIPYRLRRLGGQNGEQRSRIPPGVTHERWEIWNGASLCAVRSGRGASATILTQPHRLPTAAPAATGAALGTVGGGGVTGKVSRVGASHTPHSARRASQHTAVVLEDFEQLPPPPFHVAGRERACTRGPHAPLNRTDLTRVCVSHGCVAFRLWWVLQAKSQTWTVSRRCATSTG